MTVFLMIAIFGYLWMSVGFFSLLDAYCGWFTLVGFLIAAVGFSGCIVTHFQMLSIWTGA